MQLNKVNLSHFWLPKFGFPNQYTTLANCLDTSLYGNLYLNPVPFNEQNYKKWKGAGTSDKLLFMLQNKFRKVPFLLMH